MFAASYTSAAESQQPSSPTFRFGQSGVKREASFTFVPQHGFGELKRSGKPMIYFWRFVKFPWGQQPPNVTYSGRSFCWGGGD
jgi:hypothetical protein